MADYEKLEKKGQAFIDIKANEWAEYVYKNPLINVNSTGHKYLEIDDFLEKIVKERGLPDAIKQIFTNPNISSEDKKDIKYSLYDGFHKAIEQLESAMYSRFNDKKFAIKSFDEFLVIFAKAYKKIKIVFNSNDNYIKVEPPTIYMTGDADDLLRLQSQLEIFVYLVSHLDASVAKKVIVPNTDKDFIQLKTNIANIVSDIVGIPINAMQTYKL